MKKFIMNTMIALGVAATVLTGAINPTFAAPIGTSSPSVSEAAPGEVTQVRRWGRRWGGALLGLGALALIYEASRHHRHHRHRYYGPYPAYGYYGYGPGCYRYRGFWHC